MTDNVIHPNFSQTRTLSEGAIQLLSLYLGVLAKNESEGDCEARTLDLPLSHYNDIMGENLTKDEALKYTTELANLKCCCRNGSCDNGTLFINVFTTAGVIFDEYADEFCIILETAGRYVDTVLWGDCMAKLIGDEDEGHGSL